MFSKRSARPPLSLVALIIGITVVPLATLLWLGWRLLEQDRVLEQQQVLQRVERGADLIVSALQRAVSVSEQRLAAGNGPGADGAVAVTFRDGQIEAWPRERIAYFSAIQPLPEAPAATFARGEDLEFHQHDSAAAITSFSELARSADSAIRAGALLRLGRNLHNVGRFEEALAAYGRLSGMDGVSVGGVPAGLIGRYARCKLLEEQRRWPDLRAEALGLQRELWAGRWTLTGPVYSLYAMDGAKWTGSGSAGPRQAEVLAEAVSVLWDRWMSSRAPARASSGRESLTVNRQTFAVLWQNSDGSFRALVAGPAFVESEWLRALAPIAKDQQISFGLRDAGAHVSLGTFGTDGPKTVRGAAESALPWTVVTASLDPPVERHDFARRRQWLGAGFVLLVSMALIASYLIVRAVNREMAVARLQSDFVAAVSHEFRTPLTALRQFTDMLREHPVLDDDRRRTAYDAQSRATDRLTRLVESLLDFGRMEAGARRYRFEPRDATELVRRVVEDFRAEARAAGYDVEFRGNGSAPIDTDDEALARAVWNLLDNAVKYSPKPSHVEVGLHNRDGHVFIVVRDHGMGIPAHEQAEVFSKFYRGEQARTLGIKGTGIGLAMVDEIVKAHHGHVEVESEPGKGSTFTIVLPSRA
jgi:two-component system phosphate regulon sensor histidine kinase PhoR